MSASATTLTADDAHISFAKRLAHNNKETRCSALRKLKRWLVTKSKQGTLDQTEIIKIWKGLHYSMWYSDKPLIQEALALDISQIVTLMPDVEDSVRFFGGFCQTIAREWDLIDKLRLDKFYMFIRTALKCVLEFCAEKAWDEDIVSKVIEELDTTIINSGTCPSSVSVYISEHFLDLYSTVYTDTTPTLFITKLLMSYITTLSQTPKKDLSRVIMNNLFNPITNKTVDFRLDLQMLSSHIQQLAIQTGILTRNRKLLYRLRNDLTVAVEGDLVNLSPLGKHKLVDTPQKNGIGSEFTIEGSPEPEKKKKKKSGEAEPMNVDIMKSETTVNGHVEVTESADLVVKEEGNDDEKTVIDEVGETRNKSKRKKKKSKLVSKEEPVANSDVIVANSDVIVAESDVVVASVPDDTESMSCEQPADESMEYHEEREVTENQTATSPIAPNDNNIISESPDEIKTPPEDTEHDTPTETTPTETPDVTSSATPELVIGDSDRQPIAEQPTPPPVAKSPVRRRSERKKRRKSVDKTPTIVASTPVAATPVAATPTTQTPGTKKKVRLSMENNQTYFFKKNASLESPAPFDGTRTPVKGVLKTSPAVTRSRSRQGRGRSRLRK